MYEVRPENSIHRVDSDTSLAGAIEKADNIARTNRRRYVVVQCKTVYVAEAAPVTELPNKPMYVQQFGRGKRPVKPVQIVPFSEARAMADFFGGSFMGYPPEDLPPKHIDSNRTKPAPVVTDLVVTHNGVPFENQAEGLRQFKAACGDFKAHSWVPSQLGHGEHMCEHCKMTNREAAALNAYECKP